MTTTVFFVRHAPHALQDRVHVGRSETPLSEDAPLLLPRLARRLAGEPLAAVYASPVLRAHLTAQAIAEPHGLPVQSEAGLTEIDTGDWTGKPFAEVDALPTTAGWNSVRSLHRIPGGESMLEVQVRMVDALLRLCAAHPDQAIALVSHGDPIKAVLLYLLGLPIDGYNRFDIGPGSVSAAVVGDWGAKLLTLNDTSHFRAEPA